MLCAFVAQSRHSRADDIWTFFVYTVSVHTDGEHSVQALRHTHLVNRKELVMEKQSHVISVFKKKELTKEDYTRVWIELISALEHRKSVNFSPKS